MRHTPKHRRFHTDTKSTLQRTYYAVGIIWNAMHRKVYEATGTTENGVTSLLQSMLTESLQ